MTDQTLPTEAPARAAEGLSILQVYAKLPAQDVERARAFYAETLGLEPERQLDAHLFYQVAGSQFLVFPSSGAPSGTHDQVGLMVGDIEQGSMRSRPGASRSRATTRRLEPRAAAQSRTSAPCAPPGSRTARAT